VNEDSKKAMFNISSPKYALAYYVFTFLIVVIILEVNRELFLKSLELANTAPIVIMVLNDLPTWARLGVYFIGGLVQVIIGTFCLLLLRYLLPEKYRRYLTWRNMK